ncbi:PREDICTED: papilin-like [Amphimedon queenslandica]|uniref:BPTI/Kunitz inhibitor domain-containing protein n=1 Tax=Amphimedon queenslandica TaxID=400682 RepID=A0A1X7VBW3_AMPQE|nr:PREDICTED: papilin-like [Amphimedon queenslandica]|eukprot:XP_019849765.1 PREDICTED: papilin-like [Amphimedon queenslandica]
MLFALVFALCFQFILGSFPFHCGLILCDIPLCPNPINKPEFCCPVCPDRTPSPPSPTLPTGPPTLPPPPVVPPGGGCAGVRCDVPCPNPIPPKEGECCPRCLEDCRVISCVLPICDVPTITPLGRCCPLCPSTPAPTTSPPTAGPSCPPDVPLVSCVNAATACEEEICPNFRNARCVFDNCGGCNTKFFVGQREVTDRCGRVGDRPPSATCPPNVPIHRCANAPTACEEATCPNFPNARCIFDNCGGCDAKFFVGNRDVTKRCGRTAPAVSPPSPPATPSPPTTPSPPSCPPDVPLVFCANAATACNEATCPNFPNARCIFDNCGDCHTKFFIGNRDVTDKCTGPSTQAPPPLPHSCPPNVPLVNCFSDPCRTARCPLFPNARCIFDSCGGCNAKFFVGRREVTNRCNSHGSCPVDGQVFQECRSCPATCSNPEIACAAVCIPGCGCPDGKLIDEKNNICVDREDCSIEGGGTAVGHSCPIAGQVFQRCRSCPATCSNPNRICTLECRPGCGCPPGHVIDEANKRCVPLDKCPTSSNICDLRPKRGPCRAFIRRYYYNSLTGRCDSFIYGGCQGNENNFRSVQDCRRKCRGQGGTSSSAICLLPRVTGPCRAAFRRYFYNSATKRCEPFVYGGCAGNENNFRTLSECQSECNKETPALCLLPREPGPCRASISRWHYNSQSRQCERFIYGGCRGNDNNFSTKSECESVCHRGDPPNRPPVCTEVFCTGNPNHICTLPSDTPNTVPGRSHCDVTVCRACYHSLYPLPHPPLHRRCPQVIPLFRRNSSKCSSPDLIRQWGYCIQRAHRRAYGYLYGNLYHGGSFRCYRPPYPFYG